MIRKLFILALLVVPNCHTPQDPERTLERIRYGALRVGVVQNPPWALVHEGQVLGLEVEMVQQLASQLQAQIKWVSAGESKLMEALSCYQLDLVIGGLTQNSPWQAQVAFTQPYYRSRIMIGYPAQVAGFRQLHGQRVAVRAGTLGAYLVRRAGAIPVEADEPRVMNLPVAAEEWQLQVWGLQSSPWVLAERGHVLAVPPGENGWLAYVERFISQYRCELALLFKQQWPVAVPDTRDH